jgi:hypothetical protein
MPGRSRADASELEQVLWEPLGPMRRRVVGPEHETPSGEGADYCAVREHEARLIRSPATGFVLARFDRARAPSDDGWLRFRSSR